MTDDTHEWRAEDSTEQAERYDTWALKEAELRVAAYAELTAEQGRALYAAYVKRGLEVDRLRDEINGKLPHAEDLRKLGIPLKDCATPGEMLHLDYDVFVKVRKERDALREELENLREETRGVVPEPILEKTLETGRLLVERDALLAKLETAREALAKASKGLNEGTECHCEDPEFNYAEVACPSCEVRQEAREALAKLKGDGG